MGLNRIQPAVAAKPAKSQKTAQKAAKVEPILPETVTRSEQLEEYEDRSALCGGGCLHILSQNRATHAKALAEYFRQQAIDCLKIVPSHLKAFLAQTASILPRLRLIWGGEALS